jgi:SAM-dependent methyltransferase
MDWAGMNFPVLYHAHHGRYQEDIPFWLALAREQAGTVLELGCGSGRVLQPLGEAGFEVVGLDHDSGMLDHARAMIPPSIQKKITLLQVDFTQFSLSNSFSLAIMPCNTFSTLDQKERKRVSILVFEHLVEGGVFAFSMPNPFNLMDLPEEGEPLVEDLFSHPQSRAPVQVLTEWKKAPDGLTIRWHYDVLTPEGEAARTTVETRHTLDSVEVYLNGLLDAGFRVEKVLGDFEESPFEVDSPYLIVTAQK